MINENCELCPRCNLDIRTFYMKNDYVDKLITALNHPEPTTPIRAAWILGQRRETKAIKPLFALALNSADSFVAAGAVKALVSIGTSESLELASKFSNHPSILVRKAAKASMSGNSLTHSESDTDDVQP